MPFFCQIKATPVQRRYGQLFSIFWLATSFAMMLAGNTMDRYHPKGGAAYVLALLPVVPFLAMIVVSARYLIREKDEFIRMLITQAMLWGVGITLTVDVTCGFLTEMTGMHQLPQYANFILFFLFAAAAAGILRRRYL